MKERKRNISEQSANSTLLLNQENKKEQEPRMKIRKGPKAKKRNKKKKSNASILTTIDVLHKIYKHFLN
ncbi:Uncharacterized protein TCM_029237 [Theobroma cacao]|uniref:Uncharacterized protein n=1 Tax=Theobroma cacao TaxID=3641 RepID=A0A061GDZ2_THECC|nr:Uncharacterized protein TCM_029237 [Theobroma cacao]